MNNTWCTIHRVWYETTCEQCEADVAANPPAFSGSSVEGERVSLDASE